MHCGFLEKQDLENPARKLSRAKSSFLEKSRAKNLCETYFHIFSK